MEVAKESIREGSDRNKTKNVAASCDEGLHRRGLSVPSVIVQVVGDNGACKRVVHLRHSNSDVKGGDSM
jgi:hypothetical protein